MVSKCIVLKKGDEQSTRENENLNIFRMNAFWKLAFIRSSDHSGHASNEKKVLKKEIPTKVFNITSSLYLFFLNEKRDDNS